MQIRTAVPADLQGIVNIEAECFPAAEAATEASLSGRLAFYPNHFWVQLDGNRMIGFVNGMVTDEPDLRDEMYEDASLHNENGAWQMIFGVDNNSCETACRNAGGFFCIKGSTAAKVFFLCSIAFFQHSLYLSDFSYFG